MAPTNARTPIQSHPIWPNLHLKGKAKKPKHAQSKAAKSARKAELNGLGLEFALAGLKLEKPDFDE